MIEIEKINFEKLNGLVPVIIVDNKNNKILMLGFMNEEALAQTIKTKIVTFFSRTKNRLWVKGETSGNYLKLVEIKSDCDNDSMIIKAIPAGNICHTGKYSCFEDLENNYEREEFLFFLFNLIKSRKMSLPENSYTTKLFKQGENRIIQKVGEEAVETVIAAKNNDKNEIINEVSDLIFHLLVMLAEKEIEFKDVIINLENRHKK